MRFASFGFAALAVLTWIAACHGELEFDDPADGGSATDASLDARTDAQAPPVDCRTQSGVCPLSNLHCDSTSGACVACTTDSHCAAPTPRCDTALHRCVGCGTRGDCASEQVCEQKVCVPSCQDGGTCPGNSSCHSESQICKECQAHSDCKNSDKSRVCQVSTGRCVECLVDTDCAVGHPRCDLISGRCVRCLVSSDCPSDQSACDPATFACVRPNSN